MKDKHLGRLPKAEIDTYTLTHPQCGSTHGIAVDGMPDRGSSRLAIFWALLLESLHRGWLRWTAERSTLLHRRRDMIMVTEWSHSAK